MKTIDIGSASYTVAEHWGELNPTQYQMLIMCPRLNDVDHRTTDNEAAACMIWLGISAKKWASLSLAPWQWGALRGQFGWLFDTVPVGKPPLATFFHKGVNYTLPADAFADTSSLELSLSNMAYLDFATPLAPEEKDPEAVEQKEHALNRLVATLCRPRRQDWRKFQRSAEWNGDVREPFNDARLEQRAKALADLDMNIKLVILDYFERMNNGFLTQYGELFGSDRQPRYGDGRGWLMLLKNVAKQHHFGDFEKVCQTPAHLLFASMLDDLLDAQDEADRHADSSAQ